MKRALRLGVPAGPAEAGSTTPFARLRLAARGALRAPLALAFAWQPALAAAGEPTPAGPAFASPTFEPLLRLGIALAAILAAAWGLGLLARRRRLARGIADARIDVLAMKSLGPRHRVALLEVGDRRLLVGLGADSIRTLADLSDTLRFEQELEGESEQAASAAQPDPLGAIGRFEGLDG